jgi:hypothetical protein
MTKPASNKDKRLLGTWQSDRRRTLKELRFRPGLKREPREHLRASFGHLRLRYTRRRVYGVLRDFRFTQPYEVLASDSDPVAIRSYYQVIDEWLITHIHFHDDRHYWISFGYIREWFRRVADDAV